jgi:hypothetical protein
MYGEEKAVGGGEWKTTRPARFTPEEEVSVPNLPIWAAL